MLSAPRARHVRRACPATSSSARPKKCASRLGRRKRSDVTLIHENDAPGPGNAVVIEIACAAATEVVSSIGRQGRKAESVARDAASQATPLPRRRRAHRRTPGRPARRAVCARGRWRLSHAAALAPRADGHRDDATVSAYTHRGERSPRSAATLRLAVAAHPVTALKRGQRERHGFPECNVARYTSGRGLPEAYHDRKGIGDSVHDYEAAHASVIVAGDRSSSRTAPCRIRSSGQIASIPWSAPIVPTFPVVDHAPVARARLSRPP